MKLSRRRKKEGKEGREKERPSCCETNERILKNSCREKWGGGYATGS